MGGRPGKLVTVIAALTSLLVLETRGAPSTPTATDDSDRHAQVRTCEDIRALAAAIEAYAIDNNIYPGSDRQLFSNERLAGMLESDLEKAPHLDPWGNPYLYWSNHREYLLLGTGRDGQPDKDYAASLVETQETKATLASICDHADPAPGADVVYSGGRFCKLPPEVAYAKAGKPFSEADRQALTMKNIRAAATSVEEYAIDNTIYPVLFRGSAMLSMLKPLVEPNYIKDLPVADGWGQGMLYWSNGDHYVIQSQVAGMDRDYGADLTSAKDIKAAIKETCLGATDNPRADIVFIDGQFCQWPAGQPTN
jgi:hypothetical protein